MKKIFISSIMMILCLMSNAQFLAIRGDIDALVKNKKLKLGLALYNFSNGDTLSINGNDHFPMQSVFKFPIALAMLDRVDNGYFTLNEKVLIEKSDLRPGMWSPIQDKYPNGDVELSLSEIIKYTVAQSDNLGCDLLMKLLKGAPYINKYVQNQGIKDINIKYNELESYVAWERQFKNWTTPNAMVQLLQLFYNKKLLKPDTQTFLWDTMSQTSTGSIRNLLPNDAIVARKTGSSGYNSDNVCAALNDVGIMILPNGNPIAYAIFITNSTESPKVNANLIAEIARIVYNH